MRGHSTAREGGRLDFWSFLSHMWRICCCQSLSWKKIVTIIYFRGHQADGEESRLIPDKKCWQEEKVKASCLDQIPGCYWPQERRTCFWAVAGWSKAWSWHKDVFYFLGWLPLLELNFKGYWCWRGCMNCLWPVETKNALVKVEFLNGKWQRFPGDEPSNGHGST